MINEYFRQSKHFITTVCVLICTVGCYVIRELNCISGVMDNMLAFSVVDYGFKSRSGQTKDYDIGICSFSTKHSLLRSKSKDWWLAIRIMCTNGATCLATDCCFCELPQ